MQRFKNKVFGTRYSRHPERKILNKTVFLVSKATFLIAKIYDVHLTNNAPDGHQKLGNIV